ncbi:hypothetical protein GCM10025859_43130 [Alicyclobacillus fastidiosus]|nr:hypothetical protein GCM10025859_43130 [Alicyclobacillus fastidiosus]
MMHTRVLVTGFEPFGGETVNPALEAVKRLEGRTLETSEGRIQLCTKAIPTVFGRSVEVLEKAIEEARPDVVICVGQAGGDITSLLSGWPSTSTMREFPTTRASNLWTRRLWPAARPPIGLPCL